MQYPIQTVVKLRWKKSTFCFLQGSCSSVSMLLMASPKSQLCQYTGLSHRKYCDGDSEAGEERNDVPNSDKWPAQSSSIVLALTHQLTHPHRLLNHQAQHQIIHYTLYFSVKSATPYDAIDVSQSKSAHIIARTVSSRYRVLVSELRRIGKRQPNEVK